MAGLKKKQNTTELLMRTFCETEFKVVQLLTSEVFISYWFPCPYKELVYFDV